MNTIEIVNLPVSGAGCERISVTVSSSGLLLEFQYFPSDADGNRVGKLLFSGVAAYRFRKEMLSSGFENESYDAVVMVKDSKWLKSLIKIEPDQISSSVREKSHFAVLLSNNGYMEVIASEVGSLEVREGTLTRI